jgi:cobalt/nickel transport system ATP-binding protein
VLSLQPDVILLDEPTASLDPRTKWVLVNLIRRLGEQGKTIVTATHELEIVSLIARRVIVLGEERRVLADGQPLEILRDRALLVRANLIHPQLRRSWSLPWALDPGPWRLKRSSRRRATLRPPPSSVLSQSGAISA